MQQNNIELDDVSESSITQLINAIEGKSETRVESNSVIKGIMAYFDSVDGSEELFLSSREGAFIPHRSVDTTILEEQLKIAGIDQEFDVSRIFEGNVDSRTQVERTRKISAAAVRRSYGFALDNYHDGTYVLIRPDVIEEATSSYDLGGIPLMFDGSAHKVAGTTPSTFTSATQKSIIEVIGRTPIDAEDIAAGADVTIYHMLPASTSKISVADDVFVNEMVGRTPLTSAAYQGKNQGH